MRRLAYRPAALDDLDALYDFIAADNPARAQTYIHEIRARCRTLCDYPELGPARDDIGAGIRMLPIMGRVVVAYRVASDVIEITRVFSGGQEYTAITDDPGR